MVIRQENLITDINTDYRKESYQLPFVCFEIPQEQSSAFGESRQTQTKLKIKPGKHFRLAEVFFYYVIGKEVIFCLNVGNFWLISMSD